MTKRSLVTALVLAGICAAGAQAQYQLENLTPSSPREFFNNSAGTETEDDWVANSFQVVATGTHLTGITILVGSGFSNNGLVNQPLTITLYTGTSLTNPTGLVRIPASTTDATVTAGASTFTTVNFTTPIDLPVGQIFYAAMLIRQVPGNAFPYTSDFTANNPPPPLGRSFYDVGPTMGGSYNLDNTQNATVLGAVHPVLGVAAQDPGNLALRVVATPEPASVLLLALGLLLRRR